MSPAKNFSLLTSQFSGPHTSDIYRIKALSWKVSLLFLLVSHREMVGFFPFHVEIRPLFTAPPPFSPITWVPLLQKEHDRRRLEDITLPSASRADYKTSLRLSTLKICPSPAGIPNVQRSSDYKPAPASRVAVVLKVL